MPYRIPFNKPFFAGRELEYIAQAVAQGDVSGNGPFTRRCAEFLEERLGIHRVILTPSARRLSRWPRCSATSGRVMK